MKTICLLQATPRARTGLVSRLIRAAAPDTVIKDSAELIAARAAWLSLPDAPAARMAFVSAFIAALPGERILFIDNRAGGGGWIEGSALWGWVRAVLGAKIAFLTRCEAATELSMELTYELWVPSFGSCVSKALANMREQRRCMAAFAGIDPEASPMIDSDALADPARCAQALAPVCALLGCLAPDAEETAAVLATVEHSANDHILSRPAGILERDGEIDFHSLPPAPLGEWPVEPNRPAPEKPAWLTALPPHPATVCETIEVHTLAYGSAAWLGECLASIRLWCARHRYPLRVWKPSGGGADEKYTTLDMIREFVAGGGAKMLFLDADVLVHPKAPGFPDIAGFASRIEFLDRTISHFARASAKAGAGCAGWSYRNSGVWSCDREAAEIFLATVDRNPRCVEGYREQHQFNRWWHLAALGGMAVGDLPPEWNRFTRLEGGVSWFSHFAGKNKAAHMADAVKSGIIPGTWVQTVSIHKPVSRRAIVYPWLASAAVWEELRFSLRSLHANFSDRDCPIYIVGPERPAWLQDGGRVVFEHVSYDNGRRAGLREAFSLGVQLADEVLWMNDDIYLMRETGWDDFSSALTEGTLDERKVAELAKSPNGWHRGMAESAQRLTAYGFHPVLRFATHTPMRFERERALEVLHLYPMPYKGGFANCYFNHSGVPHRPCTAADKSSSPASGARFLNHNDGTLTDDLKAFLAAEFPQPAPWERAIP